MMVLTMRRKMITIMCVCTIVTYFKTNENINIGSMTLYKYTWSIYSMATLVDKIKRKNMN